MKLLLCLTALAVACWSVESRRSAPKVQVYTRDPGEFGRENTMICHVSDFHPPDIKILLLENGKEIPNAKQTDLAFEQNWQFHLTRSVGITPEKGKEYICQVTHGTDDPKQYALVLNM